APREKERRSGAVAASARRARGERPPCFYRLEEGERQVAPDRRRRLHHGRNAARLRARAPPRRRPTRLRNHIGEGELSRWISISSSSVAASSAGAPSTTSPSSDNRDAC